MPISFVRDNARRTVLTTVTGAIQVADIAAHFEASRHGQTLDYAELIDARGATRPYLTAAEVRRAADIVRSTPVVQKFAPRAVVVDGDVTYGLTRMFAALLADYFPIAVFRDRSEAENWLGRRLSTPGED